MHAEDRISTVDWELDIYANGKQLNHWPFSEVVSDVLNLTLGRDRNMLRVLEIGCGAGNNLWFVAASGFMVAGVDISQTAIKYARKRLDALGYEDIDLVVADMTKLPWSSAYFDIVFDRGSLTQNSYERIKLTLHEIHRVLKPGGHMLAYTLFGLNDDNRNYGVEVSENTYDHFSAGYCRNVGLTSFFDESTLRRLFSEFCDLSISRHTTANLLENKAYESYSVCCQK